jgi:hypothetical protein
MVVALASPVPNEKAVRGQRSHQGSVGEKESDQIKPRPKIEWHQEHKLSTVSHPKS